VSDVLRIESAHGTAWLEIRMLSESEEEKAFDVSATFGMFSGSVRSTTYFAGSPADLFAEAARDWRGWTGDKVWEAISHELKLSLSSETLGGCRLLVSLADGDEKLEGCIHLEAGQLESLARRAANFFGDVPSFRG